MCQHAVVPREGDRAEEEKVDLLDLRPQRLVDHELDDEGLISLLEPKFRGPILGRLLQPRLSKPYIRIHLDEVGSAIWRACDGETTVREISEELAERYGEDFDPDHGRLARFLLAMELRRFVRYER